MPKPQLVVEFQWLAFDAQFVAVHAQFLAIDGSSDAIRLRRWDDHGKVVGLDVPALETWAPLLQRVSVTAD